MTVEMEFILNATHNVLAVPRGTAARVVQQVVIGWRATHPHPTISSRRTPIVMNKVFYQRHLNYVLKSDMNFKKQSHSAITDFPPICTKSWEVVSDVFEKFPPLLKSKILCFTHSFFTYFFTQLSIQSNF